MKNLLIFLFTGFIATACTPSQERDQEMVVFTDHGRIEVSKSLTVRPSSSDEKYIDNSGETFDLDNPHEFRIRLHSPDKEVCSFLGTSDEKMLQSPHISGIWGLVDFWSNREHVMDLQNKYPVCRPPSGGVAYAFCAEKDGKAVAICIQQMTDNEAMAKEIFETFRWTD